tara:strand:- start:1404 stop:1886 length:483 start_codon:yes stop_codon:yes gene_type:complete
MSASHHPVKDVSPNGVLVRQEDFLRAYAVCGTISEASSLIGIHRSTFSLWNRNEEFRERFEESKQDFREKLERMAFERLEGQGPKDNPLLLITMLNAHWPEKYRPEKTSVDDDAKQKLAQLRNTFRTIIGEAQPVNEEIPEVSAKEQAETVLKDKGKSEK